MDTPGRIRKAAIEAFSRRGFHGASIREIASAAGCTLPALYYHYGNKADLFEKVLVQGYEELTARLEAALPQDLPLAEHLYAEVKQRKDLNEHDRAVHKLAIEVWLGIEGGTAMREKILLIDRGRVERIAAKFGDALRAGGNADAVGNLIIGIVSDLTLRVVFLGEEIPDDLIRREFECLVSLLG